MKIFTRFNRARAGVLLGTALAAWISVAQAAPLRVGVFSGTGDYLPHDSSVPIIAALRAMFADPLTANLGSRLAAPSQGFVVAYFGDTTRVASSTPSEQKGTAFVNALDTLNVAVFVNFEANGTKAPFFFTAAQMQKIEAFAQGKGLVSIHATLQASRGTWPAWDALHGTTYRQIPNGDRPATVRLDAQHKGDASWRQLNRGLPDTLTLTEEWLYFTAGGDSLRRIPYLKPTLLLDETSLSGTGVPPPMGDHPLSWYREFPSGGRFFYTALGHRPGNFTGTGSSATPEAGIFLRRQLYNAITWAAKMDSNGVVALREGEPTRANGLAFETRALAGGLHLRFADASPRIAELRALDGRRVARAVVRGERAMNAPRAGMYVLSVRAADGAAVRRRVWVP